MNRLNTQPNTTGKKLTQFALVFSLLVIVLGAFTRLTDAGLGCPDWPGCYGQLIVPQSTEAVAQANAEYPARPVEQAKAWAEMVHRYLAGSLGIMVFVICFLHWRAKSPLRALSTALSVLIIGQAALGMWTVTLGLKPIIVASHLLGGFSTFCLLLLLVIKQSRWLQGLAPRAPFRAGLLFKTATLVLALQIALGGWTAANYAATVCVELPVCQGDWVSHLNFSEAFKLWGHGVAPYSDGTSAYEFATHITPDVKITIHVMHRIGAIAATALLLLCIAGLWRANRFLSGTLAIILAVQIILGISNVLLHLPLAIAVAHNLVAVLLLGWMLVIYTWSQQHIGYRTHDARDNKRPIGQTSNLSQSPAA